MRVLQLGKFYPIKGGVEKVMLELTQGLSDQDIDCDMLCAHAQSGSLRIRLNGHGRVICCRTLVKLASTMIAPGMIFTLRRECRLYDVIHLHCPDPMAALALRLSGYKGKVVLHWHSDILKQRVLLKFYEPLQNWLIRRADRIVCTTPVMRAESAYLQEVQDKTIVIPIGIDAMETRPLSVKSVRKQYKGKKIVFSLGRLVEYKGYPYLIEAAKYLPDNYVVLIGGNGPLREDLDQKIESEGLRGKVVMLGFIADEQKQAYYGACDVYCMSSMLKTEAFGIVQIEAMSCGKPVVATNIGGSGVSWVNKHGYSGLNVNPRDAKALADAIVTVTSDDKAYQDYCAHALNRFWTLFTKDKMLASCEQLYEELVGMKPQEVVSPLAEEETLSVTAIAEDMVFYVIKNLKLREVGDRYLLVDNDNKDMDFTRVYELNKTAAWMWTRIKDGEPFTLQTIVQEMMETFDAERDRVAAGVMRQLQYWQNNGLIGRVDTEREQNEA